MKWYSSSLWFAIPREDRKELAEKHYPCTKPHVVPGPTPPGPTPPGPNPPPSGTFKVTPGISVETQVKLPARLSYKFTNKLPKEEFGERDNTHLAWANPVGGEFGGGNSAGVVGVRDYAVKSYNKDGTYAGQDRYDLPFDPSQTYDFSLILTTKRIILNIVGAGGTAYIEREVDLPEDMIVGYGWPPSQRPGAKDMLMWDIKISKVE